MRKQKGFTLIELLVVIAIIGLLSTLAVVALNNARQKSRDAKRVADIKQVQTALELYFNDQSQYPETGASGNEIGLGDTAQACLGAGGFNTTGNCTAPIYMAQVPSNPSPESDGACTVGNASAYMYDSFTGGATYRIRYCLGAATGGISAGEWNYACEGGVSGCSSY